ncbi:taurine catabolism dioxygenase, putative [Babesia caballi]|uniref:Taurine catabolism dioxygenase, putative n=1 Tax=Babesia caballi TaxID=5871 RepID=A0AAV4LNM7_BABCB|nr:taurine catabolism dioxygenase, putative [Babesia caballi]
MRGPYTFRDASCAPDAAQRGADTCGDTRALMDTVEHISLEAEAPNSGDARDLPVPTAGEASQRNHPKQIAPSPRIRRLHDFYLNQARRRGQGLGAANQGLCSSLGCQLLHTPHGASIAMADDDDGSSPEVYRRYDEKELSVVLKGHVKRLCQYFQSVTPNKDYAETIKHMVAKPRRLADSARSDSSCSTTNSVVPKPGGANSEKTDGKTMPTVGILDLAQHLASRRPDCKWPTGDEEALEFLENEHIAYDNAVMVMASEKRHGIARRVFNWKTAMKSMCTGTDLPDTPGSSVLEREDVVRVDIPLPLDPDMRDFMRKRGFVIGDDGMPITDGQETVEHDGVQFFVLPFGGAAAKSSEKHESDRETSSDLQVDLKTGAVRPDMHLDSDAVQVYDLRVNRVTTEPDISLSGDADDFEHAVQCDIGGNLFEKREESLEELAKSLFGRADRTTLDQIIDEIRKLMPDECEGRPGDDGDLSTERRERNAEGFEWFLDGTEGHQEPAAADPALEGLPEQFSWLRVAKEPHTD